MSRPVVLFPDAEMVSVTYLRAALAARPEPYAAGVVVATKVPNPRPAAGLVVLRRVGGVITDVITDRARIDAQIWHTSDFTAQALAQLVRALLLATPGAHGPVTVSKARDFLGPTYVPDPESAQPRWLLTVELSIRGVSP